MRLTAARMRSGSYRRQAPDWRTGEDPAPEQYAVQRSADGERFRVRRYASLDARRWNAEVIVAREPGESDADCLTRAYRALELRPSVNP